MLQQWRHARGLWKEFSRGVFWRRFRYDGDYNINDNATDYLEGVQVKDAIDKKNDKNDVTVMCDVMRHILEFYCGCNIHDEARTVEDAKASE